MYANMVSYSGGAAPVGIKGEIGIQLEEGGPALTYYSEEVVMRIIRGDAQARFYVETMAEIHQDQIKG